MNQMTQKTLEQIVEEHGRYPLEAFEFVRQGLSHTARRVHGEEGTPGTPRHVSGQQLCWGLRDFAVANYGVLAKAVLLHWGVHRTRDFGRIVFAMVDSKIMQTTEQDDPRDFDSVFDFETAFDLPARPTSESCRVFEI